MSSTLPNRPLRAPGEALLWFLVAFGVYVALRQEALHGTDWRWLVLWLDEPGAVHPQHPGYLPFGRAVRWLLQPFGFDVYAALAVGSAFGAALAVSFVHQATLALFGDRTLARTAAGLVLCTPALFHFGTVVELHAPFAGAMAIAVASAVRWGQSGSPGSAVRTGILVGLATLLHATGHLLVPAIGLAVWWGRRQRGFWRGLNGCLLFAVTHACTWYGIFAAMRLAGHLPAAVEGFAAVPDDPGASRHPLEYLLRFLRGLQLAQVAPTVLCEWLLPFAPVSLLAFAAVRQRALRVWCSGFLLLLLGYLAVAVVLIHAATDERGGYLIPLVVPAVWLTLLALPRRSWPWLVAATVVCGFLCRGEPGRLPPDRAFGCAAVAFAQQRPTVFFVADFPELDGLWLAEVKCNPRVARKEYDELRAAQVGGAAFQPDPEQIVAWLGLLALQARQQQARFVVTDLAVAWLGERLPAFAIAWPKFVQQAAAVRLDPATGLAGVVVGG